MSSSSRRTERPMTAARRLAPASPRAASTRAVVFRFRTPRAGELARSCGLLGQIPDAHQVVHRCRECEEPVHAARPPLPQLPHQPDRLEPAEDLFNELALLLARQIAGVARGAAV